MKINFPLTSLIVLFLSCQSVNAKNYTLFNPTPDHELRPMSTERSSKADSVTTVDPGRFQIETSLVSVIKNKDCDSGNCVKTSQTTIGDTTNLRLGLSENSDLQLVTNPYVNKRVAFSNIMNEQDGFSDITLRFKYSFSGNKSEKFGIAITHFVKLPTNQNGLGNNDIEGGVVVPFAFNLDNNWTIGGTSQLNFLKDQNSTEGYKRSYYLGYANMVYLSKSFTNKLSAFAEYYTYKNDVSNSWWQSTADFGLHYFVTNNLKIDAGFNIGLNNAADDLNYYTGFAYRF